MSDVNTMRRLKSWLIATSFALSSYPARLPSTACSAVTPASACGPIDCAARNIVSVGGFKLAEVPI